MMVDFVNYKSKSPWPVINGSNSIKFIDVEFNNNAGESWIESDKSKGSPGFDDTGLATHIITEFFSDDLVTVFPNPIKGYVTIDVKSCGVIKIYDLTGRLITTLPVSKGTHNLDFSEYDNGEYVVNFGTVSGEASTVLFINEK